MPGELSIGDRGYGGALTRGLALNVIRASRNARSREDRALNRHM